MSLPAGAMGCQVLSGLSDLDEVPLNTTSLDATAGDGTLGDAGHKKDTGPSRGDASSTDATTDVHTTREDAQGVDAAKDVGLHEDSGRADAEHEDATGEDAHQLDAGHEDAHHADAGHDAGGSHPDGGCGPTNTIENCGACGQTCEGTNASTTSCLGTSCSYSCKTGYSDCNAASPNTGGCQCATPNCCGTSCGTPHNNGVGGAYYDCVTPGTYNSTQANAACLSYTGNASECGIPLGCITNPGVVCSTGSTVSCACWGYAGAAAGRVTNSTQPGVANCSCPTTANAGVGWN